MTYLDLIVPSVLRRLDERKSRVPLAELRRQVENAGSSAADAAAGAPGAGAPRAALPPNGAGAPRPSFTAALAQPGLSLIAEVKRLSPSKGPIRPDLDVAGIVTAYQAAGVRAISVLTEEDHFAGHLDDLRNAAAHTSLPLLRKDFIVDEYQVYEAAASGASAVLLIVALLDDHAIGELAALAFHLGLDVLLEVHDPAELRRALAIDGVIVGINNRDLCSFEVSLDTTLQMAGLVPPGRLLVGESGIRERADVERLASCGVDAILVGETILREPDVRDAVRALMEPLPAVAPRSTNRGQEEA